jgi:tetratricopeptide (TPR) repeat protein
MLGRSSGGDVMRIFLSYGHDHNAPLVERIRHDLVAAGYEVWIDQAEVKAGEEWRRRIVDGLLTTNWTLAFLSKRSTRDPGVCLDEVAIALNARSGIISTILVEDVGEVNPPVTLSHIQWLDMHDWRERQAGEAVAYEAWYHEKLQSILALLASPHVRTFAGEIEELERRLGPASQAADIPGLVDGFVGREWLLARVEAWRLGETSSRLFCLTGDPGSGKSAFAAWLAHYGKANVISLNLCRYNLEDRRDAARILRTLAFQVATRLADYRALLLHRLRRDDPDGAELARKTASELFDWLLVQPLGQGIDGGRRGDRYVLVIDALDETIQGGTSELASVLGAEAHRLPEWIAVLVSGRPEASILTAFAGAPQFRIDREGGEENRADLRSYTLSWLAEGSSDPARLGLVERVVAAADGNFQYLRMLREGVLAGVFDLDDPTGLPPGLKGLYLRWFQRQFRDSAAYEQTYVPLLEVLVAAELPVPEGLLTAMFAWSTRERARILGGLGALFERSEAGVAPFHKSLRDWLIDENAAGADFVVDLPSGRSRLLHALWEDFTQLAAASQVSMPDDFLLFELPVLLADAKASPLLGDIDGVRHSELLQYCTSVANDLEGAFNWRTAVAWWQTLRRIASGENLAQVASAHEAEGRISQLLGQTGSTLVSYRAALEIRERVAAADPDNADWQRDLSASHLNIGVVLQTRGDLGGALQAYRAALEIAQRLAAAEPHNAKRQRDLSARIGFVLEEQGDLAGALQAYRAALEIAQRFTAADPENAEWQSDLASSYSMIGWLLRKQGDYEGGERAVRASMSPDEWLAAEDPDNLAQLEYALMEDAQRLAAADPENADRQCDLSISHRGIGRVLQTQGDLPGALRAYLASLEIAQRLAAADPDNARWQSDLSFSHYTVGGVLEAQGDLAGALRAHRAALEIGQRLAAANPDNNAARQHELFISHERIGHVLEGQRDYDSALASLSAALAIIGHIASENPAHAEWQRDVWWINLRIRSLRHVAALERWKSMPWWKRLFTRRPQPSYDLEAERTA